MEDFVSMSCGQLKDYLSLRCLSVSGTKAELVARAFVAWEQNIGIKLEASALKKKIENEYKTRLTMANITDPVSIPKDMWKPEVTSWPLMDMGKIFSFILKHKEFETDYIGKYKTEKAFSYFDSKFVGPILSCIQDDRSILKTEVTPSQKVNDSPRSVWLCVKKDGEIVTAWCSCTAGNSQTCNHVIAACYKIEYAITNHMNKPACTSEACEWNKSGRKGIKPSKVKDMDLRGSTGNQGSRESAQARRAFEPRRAGDNSIEASTIQDFLGGLEKINKNAVLFTGIDMTTRNVADSRCPRPISEMADGINLKDVPEEEVHTKFMDAINLSVEQCNAIEVATRGQNNDMWQLQRKGRVTAHGIHTKMNTRMKNPGKKKKKKDVVSTTVVKIVHGGKDISHFPDIAYGKENEVHAKKAFYSKEAIKHKNMQNPGIYVSKDIPYLAASPDYVLKCDCCGVYAVEIKCPAKLEFISVDLGYHTTDKNFTQILHTVINAYGYCAGKTRLFCNLVKG